MAEQEKNEAAPKDAKPRKEKLAETPVDAAPPSDGTPASEGAKVEGEAGKPVKRVKAKVQRQVSVGIAHIKASFNNTIVSISDLKGGVVAWSSAGRAGFKGSRKSTAFAATLVAQDAARQSVARGMREVEVQVQGAGSGRESAIRALQAAGLNVTVIKDVTPVPHNGCRPRKRRRV